MSPSGRNGIHLQTGGNTFAPAWHFGIFAWEAQEKSTEDQKKKRLFLPFLWLVDLREHNLAF